MNKVPKSLQAVAVTLVVGMLLPKILEFTGIVFLDKVIIKILLSLSFNIATIIVGFCFTFNIIKGKNKGGKIRIEIYLFLVLIIFCFSGAIANFFKATGKIVTIILAVISIIILLGILIKILLMNLFHLKHKFKESQESEIANYSCKHIVGQKLSQNTDIESCEKIASDKINTAKDANNKYCKKDLKSIYELWQEKSPYDKCLTITNDKNPNLKWIKIYKGPYGNGKFYGYILMANASNTVSGEVYYSNEKIWRKII